ncbi:serine/threonine-protein kinase [Streptomyces sp. NPDC058746]|uniref:serine/threonine-protein kinase n=1 Tax=Streptomyces sp. NPDC058746 TaxID=3346622 RepID=UPI0036BC8360
MAQDGPGNSTVIGGRYRLRQRLGRGGMGTVWRADDELLGRQVAVKELHVDGGTQATSALREARVLAGISHPHVVVVHDVVEREGVPFIVMELVEGGSPADRLAVSGPLTPEATARLGISLLGALSAAHARGVLHRDVKPANVLLEAGTDRVVLTDFGIARLAGATTISEAGAFVGSPEYTAPERMRRGGRARGRSVVARRPAVRGRDRGVAVPPRFDRRHPARRRVRRADGHGDADGERKAPDPAAALAYSPTERATRPDGPLPASQSAPPARSGRRRTALRVGLLAATVAGTVTATRLLGEEPDRGKGSAGPSSSSPPARRPGSCPRLLRRRRPPGTRSCPTYRASASPFRRGTGGAPTSSGCSTNRRTGPCASGSRWPLRWPAGRWG